MKNNKRLLILLLPLLILSLSLNGQDSTPEGYTIYQVSDPVPVTGIAVDTWVIEDATLRIDHISEPSSVLAPAKIKGEKISFEMIKPKSKFIVLWLKIKNNSSKKLSILPLFLKPILLRDKEGKTHEISDRMKSIGALIPEVSTGSEKKFYLYFDVPKETKPASIQIDLIKTIIKLD